MQGLNGKDFLGRPIKIGPGVARAKGKLPIRADGMDINQRQETSEVAFDRWTRTDAPEHWKQYNKENRRLIVSGLPKMPDHYTVNKQVRHLFEGFTMHVLSSILVLCSGD